MAAWYARPWPWSKCKATLTARGWAWPAWLSGRAKRAEQERHAAAGLRKRFNRDFWADELGCYLLALQAQGHPAAVVASNAGQALWTGIADNAKVSRTVDRLMAADMFNGWGIPNLIVAGQALQPDWVWV